MPRPLRCAALLAVLSFALLAAGCGGEVPDTLDTGAPVAMSHTTREGHAYSWQVPTAALAPGETLDLTVRLDAGDTGPWEGQACLSLLDGGGVAAHLANAPFNLQPGESIDLTLPAQIPSDLPPGEYGLSLLVVQSAPQEDMYHTLTVTVGEGVERSGAMPRWGAPTCP